MCLSLARSRSHARDLIKRGCILNADGEPVDKPSRLFPADSALKLRQDAPVSYVSRAGEKLHGYLHETGFTNLNGLHVLDIGASTGGFSDCALRHGAESVTCVDVGHGQLADSLRQDPRVTNLEGINARELNNVELPRPRYDLVMLDLSFISLKLVLEQAWARVEPQGYLIALIKPQFEVGRNELGTGGIVRDHETRERARSSLEQHMLTHLPGACIHGRCVSPLVGGDGNEEFLIGLTNSKQKHP